MPPNKKKSGKAKGSKKASESSEAKDLQPTEEAAPSLPLVPIQKCPEDILLIIFQFYLIWDTLHFPFSSGPSYIRRLLLVCKHWHIFGTNTPQLWTNIRFSIPFCSEEIEISQRRHLNTCVIPFMKACLKHSGSSLLHIDADLDGLMSERAWYNHVERLHFNSEWDDRYLSVADVQKELSLLTGKNGSNMDRWGSLVLHLPDTFTDYDIPSRLRGLQVLKVFTGPTPNLSRLIIHGIEVLSLVSAKWDVLPNLSSLRHLSLEEVMGEDSASDREDVGIRSLGTAPLEHLKIPIDSERNEWPDLCRKVSLRSLELSASGYYENVLPVLTLPHLEKITFLDDHRNLSYTKLDFPSLKHICLRPSCRKDFTQFPSLRPMSITWDPLHGLRDWKDEDIEKTFKKILLQYPSIELIKIPTATEAAFRKVVAQIKELDGWISSLKSLQLFSEEKGETLLDAASI